MTWLVWCRDATVRLEADGRASLEMMAAGHDFAPLFYGDGREADPEDYKAILGDAVFVRVFKSDEVSIDEDLEDLRKIEGGDWKLPRDIDLHAAFAVDRLPQNLDLRFCVAPVAWERITDFLFAASRASDGYLSIALRSNFMCRVEGVPKVHAVDFLDGRRTAWSPEPPTLVMTPTGSPPEALPRGLRAGRIITDHLR